MFSEAHLTVAVIVVDGVGVPTFFARSRSHLRPSGILRGLSRRYEACMAGAEKDEKEDEDRNVRRKRASQERRGDFARDGREEKREDARAHARERG